MCRRSRVPEIRGPFVVYNQLSGAFLAAALVFGPWCWGCTWPSGIHQLDLLLLVATMCGLPALWQNCPPGLLRIAVATLLLQGWLLTFKSRSIVAEATGYFAPLQPLFGFLPGTVERDLSRETMPRITALLGAALVACSLGRERRWRDFLVATLVVTAVSIVLLGCVQRWTGAADIFWGPRHLDYFFATFRNVTNAGEYLNLALPLAAASVWLGFDRSPVHRAAAICALAILLAGILIGGSKAAPLVLLGVAILFLVAMRRELMGKLAGERKWIALTLVVAIFSMAWGAGDQVSADRWQRLFAQGGGTTLESRLEVDQVCLAHTAGAGWAGYGPGTFAVLFPRWQAGSANAPAGRWQAAHNDYLQTFLEWGPIGVVAWSVYFFGAMGCLVMGWRRRVWRRGDRVGGLGIALALGGIAVMAAVDFPLQMASIQLGAAVLIGLGWSSLRWPRAHVSRAPRIVLRGEGRFLPSHFTRWVDRRCCEYDLSGSVDPKTGTNSKP